MPLPTPIGRQREVLYLPAEGHVAVLGTAGSGKTTLAILRAAYLADPSTDHHGKTLLVTFNLALVAYLKNLKDFKATNIVVENYHKFARGYLSRRGKVRNNSICSDSDQRNGLISRAISEIKSLNEEHPLFNKPLKFFSEEIRWLAQHGIKNVMDYESAERIGRAAARIPRRMRKVMFEVWESYKNLRGSIGKDYDWDDLATAVCTELDIDDSPRLYKHVVIDEGQDFSPEMISSLAKAIPADGSVTFFGDVAQQIYGHQMTWRSAGLAISKVWEFKNNYRNSKQIAKLALAISKMPYYTDLPDIVEPVSPIADGPLPTLIRFDNIEEEIKFVIEQANKAAKRQSVAIFLRNRSDEDLIESGLLIGRVRLHRNLATWISGPGIRYGTYHSAKGLEFDTVILPFCSDERLPDPKVVEAIGFDDALSQEGRLLYVGVTRAKTRLIITFSGKITTLLPNDKTLYEVISR